MKKKLSVLCGCEMSGVCRTAFEKRGWDAVSCDLLPSQIPGKHIQGDIREVIGSRHFDLALFFPPCTYCTISAEWAYTDGPYHQKVKPETLVGAARRQARIEAVEFVRFLMNVPIKHIAVENPIGCLSRLIRKPDQIIQPHWFGEDASKSTCLWLNNLPLLKPTGCVLPRLINGKPRWGNQTDSGQNKLSPSDDRGLLRGVTYPGIADAFASQWGTYIENLPSIP